MKRRLYVDPESGGLEDCTGSPYSWDSSFVVILRGHDDLWERFLEAERVLGEARRAVLDAASRESMTAEEQALHDRCEELHMLHDLDSGEWMRRHDEIEEAAKALALRDDGASAGDPTP